MLKLIDTEDLRFLLSAMPKACDIDSKYRLDVICSTMVDGMPVMACTDSMRLHVIDGIPYQLAPGLYTVLHDKKNKTYVLEPIDGRFPEFARVLESAQNTEHTADFYGTDGKKDMLSFSTSVANFFHAYPGAINLQFLQDLGNDVYDAWFNTEGHGPCFFINHSKVAVLMPMRF